MVTGYRLQDAIYEICNCDNVEYRKNNNLYAIMKWKSANYM